MADRSTPDVVEIAREILSDLDLESVLERVLTTARELTGARYAALGVLDDAGRGLARFLTDGIDASTRQAIGPLPTGRGVLGELIEHPVPLRLDNVGAHPRSYGFPTGHPPMTTFLGVPILAGGKPFGNLYLTDKQGGGPFTDDDEASLVTLADLAGMAVRHAREYAGSESRREQLEETVEALDVTVQIGRALGGQTDFRVIVDLIAKRARALVSARALVIEHEQGDALEIVAAAGDVPPDIVGARREVRTALAGPALSTLRPHRFGPLDLQRLKAPDHPLSRLPFQPRGGLAVPLTFKRRGFGVLLALDRMQDGPDFSRDDERLLEAFAGSAATAVATARTVESDRRSQRLAATETERTRWARELHDQTLQGLAAVRMAMAAARRLDADGKVAAAIEGAIGQLDEEITSLRVLIMDLRPSVLDALGTEAAVEALADRARARGADIDVDIDLAWEQGRAQERHADELETGLYRIAQEAINNAIDHGAADRIALEITEDEQEVRLTVTDDGRGFEPGAAHEGFGLLGMRERAELLDGTFTVESSPGEGAVVRAAVPVRRRQSVSSTGFGG
jgi:two-component system, NarL family, sensor histidine kinase DevS